MEIYSLKEEYIQYLQKFDNRVCVSKLDQAFGRKYVGVVFQINDVVYFAPLSSKQKERHFTDVLLFDNKSQLGSVKINNMVPVPKKYKDQLIELCCKKWAFFTRNYLQNLTSKHTSF